MFKLLKPTKDTYITNKVVDNDPKLNSNVGNASTLDLFKLYGMSETNSLPNTELSRLLIKFDLQTLRDLVTNEKIDMSSAAFKCKLKMFDVDGGQTVPNNFGITLYPLSKSFDEGIGKDIVLYGDRDTCNFLTSSFSSGPWALSGSGLGGLATDSVDYITSAVINNVTTSLAANQSFVIGTEDLDLDITQIVSATLTNIIPDEGFRITFEQSLETDTQSYFVKRFAARNAYDDFFHPRLEVLYDDSINDDTLDLNFDLESSLFLYNYDRVGLKNLTLNSTEITGSNSLLLTLSTPVSGGFYKVYYTGSQHKIIGNDQLYQQGIYSASINVPLTNQSVIEKLNVSGSVAFTPIWSSFDNQTTYATGSNILLYQKIAGSTFTDMSNYTVNVTGLKPTMGLDEKTMVKVNVFNNRSPKIKVTKTPVILPSEIIRDVHYQIRDVSNGKILIPFDITTNSTKISSDDNGMYFQVNSEDLIKDKLYVIDIMIYFNENKLIFKNASSNFKVTEL